MFPNKVADQKVGIVLRCIQDSINSPDFIHFVQKNFGSVNKKDIISILWRYQDNFSYILENINNDYCKDALEFIRDGWGDCEDFTVFNSSTLIILGVQVRIRVTDTKNSGYFTHILIKVFDPAKKTWVPFDGTFRKNGLGGEPPFFKAREYIL